MDEIRKALAPLTDWMPDDVRGRLDVEVWWLLFLVLALVVLLLAGLLVRGLWRSLFGRRRTAWDRESDLCENLAECPLPVAPEGDRVLTVYHLPVRLRLVVVAPAGKEADVDATAVEQLLERVVPGLGAVAARDRPRIRV